MSTMEYGYVQGDTCNRDGCNGIIDEHEKSGSCSCHINPPCGYCTTNAEYCPVCGWEAQDEPTPVIDPEIAKRNQEYYAKQMRQWNDRRDRFYRMWRGEDKPDKLEMMHKNHTHMSQIWMGVFPVGTETPDSILPKVNGTFGGRWSLFDADNGRFEYIAYTD